MCQILPLKVAFGEREDNADAGFPKPRQPVQLASGTLVAEFKWLCCRCCSEPKKQINKSSRVVISEQVLI